MINHPDKSQNTWDNGKSMTIRDWNHHFEFKAFYSKQPKTKRIAVGVDDNLTRCMINHRGVDQEFWDNGANMNTNDWTHHCDFWAFKEPQPGCIRIAVHEAQNPHRVMLNHQEFSQTEHNLKKYDPDAIPHWTYLTEFWAYPSTITTKQTDWVIVPTKDGGSISIKIDQ